MTIFKWMIALSIVQSLVVVASCRAVRANECAASPGNPARNSAIDSVKDADLH